jgi:hypothetical protein
MATKKSTRQDLQTAVFVFIVVAILAGIWVISQINSSSETIPADGPATHIVPLDTSTLSSSGILQSGDSSGLQQTGLQIQQSGPDGNPQQAQAVRPDQLEGLNLSR